MSNCKIYKIKNGITIIVNHIKYLETACVGIFSSVGSRVENKLNMGICHFLEHMVFKGTNKRSMYDISEEIESKGGYINAWTSKEKTAWYAKVMKQDIFSALEVIVDILRDSIFLEEEIYKEKSVVIQEIKQYRDSPDDLIHSYFHRLCFPNHPLGFDILGTEEIVNSFTREHLFDHMKKYYTPNKMVLSVVGNIDNNMFFDKIQYLVGDWKNENEASLLEKPNFNIAKQTMIKTDLSQTQLIIGYEALPITHKDYYKYIVFSSILGSGMSSRLFKEIREKRGLVYHIDSTINSYIDIASLNIQAACEGSKVNEVIHLIEDEIYKLSIDEIDIKELIKVKKQLISSLYMRLESSYSIVEKAANSMINFNRVIEIEEIANNINQVQSYDVMEIAKQLVAKEATIAVLSDKLINL